MRNLKRIDVFFPVVSAVLLFLSFYFEPGCLLAHVALAPLLVCLLRGGGLFSAWVFGAAFGALYFFWLRVFSGIAPVMLTLMHGLWVAAGLGPAIWLRRRALRTAGSRPPSPIGFFFACIVGWACAEWVRSLGPYGYEWGSLGYTQYGILKVTAYASQGGMTLLTIIVLVSNLFLVWAWEARAWKRLWGLVVYISLLSAMSPFPSLSADIGPAADFALVQTNVNPYLNSSDRMDVTRTQLDALAKAAARSTSRIFILPETVFSGEITGMRGYLSEDHAPLLMPFLYPRTDRVLVVGAIEKDENGFYNAAMVFDATGHRTGSYRKCHLVPFGEDIPVFKRYEWVRNFGVDLGTPFFSAGSSHLPVDIGGHKVAMLVCFEGTFSRWVAKASSGAGVLVNISNDAWSESDFGHQQHLRFLRFRAIETGRPVIRVGNSGPTALYAPNGELVANIPQRGPGFLDLGLFRNTPNPR